VSKGSKNTIFMFFGPNKNMFHQAAR